MATIYDTTVKAMPKGRLYRLDWVRDVFMVPGRITPMINVQMTPLINEKAGLLHGPLSFDHAERVIVPLSVGWHPALRIGSFWRNGRIRQDTGLQRARITVNVSTKTMKSREAFHSKSNVSLIPPHIYRLDRSMADTRVIVFSEIKHETYRRLIIPCSEISRFYYTNSSPLALHAFSGAFVDEGFDRIFDVSRSEPRGNGTYYVQLGTRIPDSDHLTVGRMAASNIAKREARMLVGRAIAARNEGGGYQIDIRPPFEGQTTLDVLGIPIPVGRAFMFLALQILHCDAPFPFEELLHGRDNDGRTAGAPRMDKRFREAWARVKKHSTAAQLPAADHEVYEDDDPDGSEVPVMLQAFDPSKVFRPVPTRKIEKKPIESKSESQTIPVPAAERFAIGHQQGSSPNTPLLLTAGSSGDEEDNALDPRGPGSLHYFEEALDAIKEAAYKEYHIDAEVERHSRRLTYTLGRGRKRHPWAYLDGREFTIPRRVLMPKITLNGLVFYLIEIERRTLAEQLATFALWQPTFSLIGDAIFESVLHVLARSGSISWDVWQQRGLAAYEYHSIRHPHQSHDPQTPAYDYAARIVGHLALKGRLLEIAAAPQPAAHQVA